MSRDLEGQLDEMGPAYRAVVMRLRGAETVSPHGTTLLRGGSVPLPHGRRWLIAASPILIIGLGVLFLKPGSTRPPSPVPHPSEYTMDVSEMIATQNPDGSWKNDFLTRRNAVLLKECETPEAKIAYKKAVRNLRLRGVL